MRSLRTAFLVGTLGVFVTATVAATQGAQFSHLRPAVGKSNPVALFAVVNRDIVLFDQSFNRLGSIRAKYPEPGGAVAADGSLYIGYAYQPLIQVFKPPYDGKPVEFNLHDPARDPLSTSGIAIDQHTGLVAISSFISSHLSGGPEGVFFFKPGQTEPCNLIKGDVDTVAFDASGVLFYTTDDEDAVGMVKNGCKATALEPLKLDSNVAYEYRIAVDRNDDIAISQFDPSDPNSTELATYRHPVDGKFGKALAVTSISERQCYFESLTGDGMFFWDTCYPGDFEEFAYKGNGVPVRSVTVNPRSHPGEIFPVPAVIPK